MSEVSRAWQSVLEVIIPHPSEPRVLAVPREAGWGLPRVPLAQIWSVELGHINTLLRQEWGITTAVLRRVAAQFDERQRQASLTYLLDNRSLQWEPPAHGRWIGRTALDELTDVLAEQRTAMEDYLTEAASGEIPVLRAPWACPGWLDEAAAWIEVELRALGTPPIMPVEQVKSWGISCVLRVRTTHGLRYFKATAALPLFAHEPSVMTGLAQMFPDYIPAPLHTDEPRRWMLMQDFGPLLARDGSMLARAAMVRVFCIIQRHSAGRVDDLLRMGCVDRRLERLASQLEGLLTDTAALAGLSAHECERLPSLVPHLQRLCTRLAQGPVPQTLVHGDLYLKNVAYNAGQYQFFDWSDACVTHPFFDMMTIYTETDPHVYLPLRDTYLTLWTDSAPMAQLLEAWELAAPLSYLHQAIGYQHIVAGLEPSARVEFRNAVPYYVRQALQAITPRHLEL